MDPAYLFNIGQNYEAYKFLGMHRTELDEQDARVFRVWAPHAHKVSLAGDFNGWSVNAQPMLRLGETGIWETTLSAVPSWSRYKYFVVGKDGKGVWKADPFSLHQENRPGTSSIVYDEDPFAWTDEAYLSARKDAREPQPLNIYEVHLGSWRRYDDGNSYNYRDIAPQLVDYCLDLGYNAVELMGIMEYPLDDSWGYQVTGYFAPTSRYGTPLDFKFLVNTLHAAGIKVFLDWVPAHFPKDEFGLFRFDGSATYEYADSRLAEQEEWGTMVFDFAKAEVRSFLISSACFWLREMHLDGLRVDAVSSMLYLDYGHHEAIKNRYGSNENLDAIDFLRVLNKMLADEFPCCFIMAEESTAFPYITKSVEEGGLGFTHKWNMGWMHDTLDYFKNDYYARRYVHNKMTFSMTYAFAERHILPYSHDEVVHGKLSLIGRQPGDIWRQCASLRVLFAWQIAHPGAKLNFMGNEFGQFIEWRFREQLEWFMLDLEQHRALQNYSRELNHLYLQHGAFWEKPLTWDGFEWMQADDAENSIFAFVRKGQDESILALFNMTPAVLPGYVLRVPQYGRYELLLNSDDVRFGGSGYWGESSQGKIFATNPLSQKEMKRQSQERENRCRTTLRELEREHENYLKQRQHLLEKLDQQVGGAAVDHESLKALHQPLPAIPKELVFHEQSELVLDLPPLAAVFFRLVDV